MSEAEPTPADQAPPRMSPPMAGRRALSIVLLISFFAGSGYILDHDLGVRGAPAAASSSRLSGAWFCPHGGGDGWKGWMVLTNPERRPVRVRISSYRPTRPPVTASFVLAGNRQLYREIPVGSQGSATEVEYFGGWVAAASVLESSGEAPSVAAERCVSAPQKSWFVPDGTTSQGDTSYLIVMNPFASDAAFDVVLRTEDRALRPGPLTPFVVPAGRSAAIKLNSFALQGPSEHSVAAQVTPVLGRVIAGGLSLSTGGIRGEAGSPVAAARWILPLGGYGDLNEVVALDATDRPGDLIVIRQGARVQRTLGLGEVRVQPDRVETVTIEDVPNSGTIVESTNKTEVALARRVSGPKGDVATVAGVPNAARSWLVLPSTPPTGGSGLLVIQNPGRSEAEVTVRLIGKRGPAAAPSLLSILVPAGRTRTFGLLQAAGALPLSALVTARSGTIVAATASYSLGGSGFAATLGVPLAPRK